MNMNLLAVSVVGLLVVVIAVAPAMATDYTVGDSSGWTQGVDYKTWASDKTFKVGDTLVFTYGFLHSVNEVSKSDYDGCSSSNSIQSYTTAPSTKWSSLDPGGRYFICGTPGHCSGGMKLAVSVASSGSDGNGNGKHLPSTLALGLRSPTTPSGLPAKNTPDGASTAGGGGVNGLVAAMAGALFAGLALLG
ncbi:LOW QUALITY PROTEIN: blue copper protein-like [Asparagus officinalis]|uniref:LOW QUALITY PROTEIN: blue copper protein-like n=1 Tax=Asparagus officinalis TaxID=4686 RepID=UPI00098DFCE1|nr:LOW QUALITY PROTEIN: blue copper protein-like [Asparagus officinalis]